MVPPPLGPVRDDGVEVGLLRREAERLGEAEVVADERRHAEPLDVPRDDVGSPLPMTFSSPAKEKGWIFVYRLDAPRPGETRRARFTRERLGRLGDAGEEVQAEGGRALPEERSVGPPSGWAIRCPSIEKPVANISGRIARRAPSGGGLLEEAGGPRVVGGDVFPGDVELEEGDLHRADSRASRPRSRADLALTCPSRPRLPCRLVQRGCP